MDTKLKARIKELIDRGTLKCNALTQLKREYPKEKDKIATYYNAVKEEMYRNKEWRAIINGIPAIKNKKTQQEESI